jgi:hypothetical protein
MNIMYDPRVVRGVTVGRPSLKSDESAPPVPRVSKESREAYRQHLVKLGLIRPQLKSTAEIHAHIVVAKKRTPLNLTQFLTEQVKAAPVSVESTQTDKLKTPPASPPSFRPRKVGRDAASQVEDAAVFDFDRDVAPLAQLLIGHTLEQALREVRHQEALKNVSARTSALDAAEAARDRAAADRAAAEQERQDRLARLRGEAERRGVAEQRVGNLLRAHALARSVLQRLQPAVAAELGQQGVLGDAHARAVEAQFMPWLLDKVRANVRAHSEARELADDLLAHTLRSEAARAAGVKADRAAALAAAVAAAEHEAQEQQQRARVKLLIQTELSSDPVTVVLTGMHTIADVEQRVREWVRAFVRQNPGVLAPDVSEALLAQEENERRAAAGIAPAAHETAYDEEEFEEEIEDENGDTQIRVSMRRVPRPRVSASIRFDWGNGSVAAMPEAPLHSLEKSMLQNLHVVIVHDVEQPHAPSVGGDMTDLYPVVG